MSDDAVSASPPSYKELSSYPSQLTMRSVYPPRASTSYLASNVRAPDQPPPALIDHQPQTSTPALSSYSIDCTTSRFHHDRLVRDASGTVVYYVGVPMFWKHRREVLLLRGSDATGHHVGTGKFSYFNSNIRLSLKDEAEVEGEQEWLSMRHRPLFSHKPIFSTAEWAVSIPTDSCGYSRSYIWRRRWKKEGGARWIYRKSSKTYKIIDVESGEVIALYDGSHALPERPHAKLQMMKDVGMHTELYLLLAAASFLEFSRRRLEKAQQPNYAQYGLLALL